MKSNITFKFSTESFIKFNPYDGYFVLRLTDFKSNLNLDRKKFIKSIIKYIYKNWFLIEMFHDRSGHLNFSKIKKRRNVNNIKWKIFKRDNFTCQKCGSQEFLELDHIIPVSKGGEDKEKNYQTFCQKCNREKKDKV